MSSVSLLLDYARSRVRAFLDETQRLKEIEFAYRDSEDALDLLMRLFERTLEQLELLDAQSDPDVVRQKCSLSLRDLFRYTPLLGFILRSTNVRNAFEACRPLRHLARQVLEHESPEPDRRTRLVISSEWDYSPFVYPTIPDLPDFVLIGLPAPESSNPLLFPLAGHELGHSVWDKRRVGQEFAPRVRAEVLHVIASPSWWKQFQHVYGRPLGSPADLTTDMFAVEFWQQAVPWALQQVEETFCDFVGLRLFRESYLKAFAYLLAPTSSGPRSVSYPSRRARVRNLCEAASTYEVDLPSEYEQLFGDQPDPKLTQADTFRLSVADEALSACVADLVTRAGELLQAACLPEADRSEVERILRRLRQVVPAENCRTIVDIINAAWRAFEDDALWKDLPQIHAERHRSLRELVLKNVEVFEIEHILRESA